MSKVAIMMADGCEMIEALAVVDLLRRAGIEIDLINIMNRDEVLSSHKVRIGTELKLSDMKSSDYDCIILPGGKVGTDNLKASDRVMELVREFDADGKKVCAICAAPTALAKAGVVSGKKVTSYPGDAFEESIKNAGASYLTESVVIDGNMITSRGMGTAIPFGLAIIAAFMGQEKADEIGRQIVFS